MLLHILFGSMGIFICVIIYVGTIIDYSYLLALLPVIVISFFSWLGVRYREKNNPKVDDFL